MTSTTKTVKFIDLINGDPQRYLYKKGALFSVPGPDGKLILGYYVDQITNHQTNNISEEKFTRAKPIPGLDINSALKFEYKLDGIIRYSYVYINGTNPYFVAKPSYGFGFIKKIPSSNDEPTGYDYTIGIDYMTPVFGVETSAQDKLPEHFKKVNNKIIIGELQVTVYNSLGGRKWSAKYKKSINCKRPKGFSQRQHCKYGRKKTRKNRR
jgi:hypothetical protein